MTDYSALAEQAAKDRQSANTRFQEARADSETSALRELVFTAASYGVTRLLLEPSDQGSYMTVSEIEPEVDGEAEDIIGDSGSYDMSDYHHADWLAEAGVIADEVDFRDEQVRKASIDVTVAAEALANKLREPTIPPTDIAELVAAIDNVVAAWDGGDLAGAVNAARETANEYREEG